MTVAQTMAQEISGRWYEKYAEQIPSEEVATLINEISERTRQDNIEKLQRFDTSYSPARAKIISLKPWELEDARLKESIQGFDLPVSVKEALAELDLTTVEDLYNNRGKLWSLVREKTSAPRLRKRQINDELKKRGYPILIL